jgi:NAD(P)-dependent dehydrogenase (short-subunit alcohol dehydrogenase family)
MFTKCVSLVTGSGQGIGKVIALRFASEGSFVVIADLNEENAVQTAKEIKDTYGLESLIVKTDVSDEEQVQQLMEKSYKCYNRIDFLINNSGIAGVAKKTEEIHLKEWQATMQVNVNGIFLCCKHAIPFMKNREMQRSIVNIASVTGKRPLINRLPYATSKMAVIGLSRTLAAEVGPDNIRVNSICPGAILGERQQFVIENLAKAQGKSFEEVKQEKLESSPLRSFVDPKYIAGLATFLCSNDAAMITGQDINVSAGVVMY